MKKKYFPTLLEVMSCGFKPVTIFNENIQTILYPHSEETILANKILNARSVVPSIKSCRELGKKQISGPFPQI